MNQILIGIPNGSGFFPAMTVEALLKLRKPCPCMVSVIERQRTDKARNALVKMALDSKSTHLLFIDDDNPPSEDALEKFLLADKDIVCSPILSRNPNKDGFHDLCIFEKYTVKEGKGKDMNMYKPMNKVPDGLFKVGGCGMGCTLIKKEVLEKLWKKYEGEPFAFGDTTYTTDPKKMNGQRRTMSEDMEFIERATQEGFEVWCDSRVKIPHIGSARVLQFNDSYLDG